MDRYNFKSTEEKWQKFWDRNKTFKTKKDLSKKLDELSSKFETSVKSLREVTSKESKLIIENEKLHELLDIKINEDFNQLKDAALSGDRAKTNRLLSDTIIEAEKNVLYINIINQRLNKLYEVLENSKLSNLSDAISKMKPPIFWKDKPMFLNQSKKWSAAKIRNIINKSYNLETEVKSNASINKNILIKKLLIDICETANS